MKDFLCFFCTCRWLFGIYKVRSDFRFQGLERSIAFLVTDAQQSRLALINLI